jgi:hypothetical protein
LREVLRAVSAAAPSLRPAVVLLWSLDAPKQDELTVANLEDAQAYTCGTLVSIVKETTAIAWNDYPQVWLVTRGAQTVKTETTPVSIAQAPLWGLGRVLALEHPELWKGLIDLDTAAPAAQAARQLCEEILSGDAEDQLAIRGAERYGARLVKAGERQRQAVLKDDRSALRIHSDGTYLITGGLGDLGLLVARWMAQQGARHLILMARTPLPPRSDWEVLESGTRVARQIAAIRELESIGAEVHLAAVDVADETGLVAFLKEISEANIPPIRGVVHAAGVVEPKSILDLDAENMKTVLRPKLAGGYLLNKHLNDAPLDFFVLFSSASSVLSSPLLGSYAAANASSTL